MLSPAIVTYSIPLQYIWYYTSAIHPFPSPKNYLNGSSCELNHISECDGKTCKLHCTGHAIGLVYSYLTVWFCTNRFFNASMCDFEPKWVMPYRYNSIIYEMSLLQVNFGNDFLCQV